MISRLPELTFEKTKNKKKKKKKKKKNTQKKKKKKTSVNVFWKFGNYKLVSKICQNAFKLGVLKLVS